MLVRTLADSHGRLGKWGYAYGRRKFPLGSFRGAGSKRWPCPALAVPWPCPAGRALLPSST
jgi:hypothetical protein